MKRASPQRKPAKPRLLLRSLATLTLLGVALATTIYLVRRETGPGDHVASQGNQHIAEIGEQHPDYNTNPPTSGWHVGTLAPWGAYDYIVPDELLLHNMEDGGVILWYAFGTPTQNQDRIRALQTIANGYAKTIIAPREDMPTPYALTAWQRLQRFDSPDRNRMRAFLTAYHGIDHHSR